MPILEDDSNDTNESERKEIIVLEINNISNNQKDFQQEMNNLNIGKTNSIEKQLKDVKIKKREEYYWSKNNLQSDTAKEYNSRKRTMAKKHNINRLVTLSLMVF